MQVVNHAAAFSLPQGYDYRKAIFLLNQIVKPKPLSRGLEGIPLETQTNAMFVDRRAGASEYSLLKRNFSTCTRIATREWQ